MWHSLCLNFNLNCITEMDTWKYEVLWAGGDGIVGGRSNSASSGSRHMCTCAHADTFCKRNHRSASGLVCDIQCKLVTSLRREMPTQGFVCSVALQGHVLTALSGGNWVQKVLEKESDSSYKWRFVPGVLILILRLSLLQVFLAVMSLGATEFREMTTGGKKLDSLVLRKGWVISHLLPCIRITSFIAP